MSEDDEPDVEEIDSLAELGDAGFEAPIHSNILCIG